MKPVVLSSLLLLFSAFVASAQSSAQYGVQDLMILDNIRVPSSDGMVVLDAQIKAKLLESPGASVTFPAGAVFVSSSVIIGRAGDVDLKPIRNTSVIPGVLSYGGSEYVAMLTTSDLLRSAETIGVSDVLEFPITSLLPSGVSVGAQGRMDYTFIQFSMLSDPTLEIVSSALELAAIRAARGALTIPSMDGISIAETFDMPFVVGAGSETLRFLGKGLCVVGSTLSGTLGGAVAGSGAAGIGAVAGGILGGLAGFFTSLGGAILENNRGDSTPDPDLPFDEYGDYDISPDPDFIPELSHWGVLSGFGLLGFAICRRWRGRA